MHPRLAYFVSPVLSLLLNKWHLFAAVFLYYYTTRRVFDYFYTLAVWGAWAPAWPIPRTAFIITCVSTAIWCACMFGGMIFYEVLVWFYGKGKGRWNRRRGYHVASESDSAHVLLSEFPNRRSIDDDERESRTTVRTKTHQTRRRGFWWWSWLALFASGALTGWYQRVHYEQPNDYRFKNDVSTAIKVPKPEGYGNGERIFFAAMFHNNQAVIPYWGKELIRAIHYLGPKNVHVSVVESYSDDASADRLKELQEDLNALGVENTFRLRDTSIERPPSMESAPPRIQFLSATRNLAIEPLVQQGGFDRLVFSNDIFIEAESIVELLKTKDGNWDMVCGIDLSFWGLYDAWVVRDRLGRLVSSLWPYFLEDAGFKAVMKDEPAPVFTCWNGIVAVRTEPFYPTDKRTPGKLPATIPERPIPSSHPEYPMHAKSTPAEMPPLKFRKSTEKECFSSESFLLPYDLRRQFNMQDIYMNTRVITSYDWGFYVWYKWILRHPWVKWWIEKVENGNGIHLAKMVIGNGENVWTWDGGDCQPWF